MKSKKSITNIIIFLTFIFIILFILIFTYYHNKSGISITIKSNNEKEEVVGWLNKLNIIDLVEVTSVYITNNQYQYNIHLKKNIFDILMPNYNTLSITKNINNINFEFNNNEILTIEILLCLLGSPVHFIYDSLNDLLSEISMRQNICYYASKTYVSINTRHDITIERPNKYFRNTDNDIVLLDDKSLTDGIIYSLLPSVSGNIYEFSCYRVCEYVVLLSILLELKKQNKEYVIQKIESTWRKQQIKSKKFHDVFLTEFGSNIFPLPKLFYIPGDKLWFKNPDDKSSDVVGFEGKWTIYLGNGLFGDFWKTCGDINNQFTFEDILIEMYNWRFCVKYNKNNELYIDEEEVYYRNRLCKNDKNEKNKIVNLMNNYRNKYFFIGGSIDKTREKPKNIEIIEKYFLENNI